MHRSSYKLKELVTEIDYGYTAKATDQDTGIKFLRITDIAQGSLNWSNVPFCEISEEIGDKYQLFENDIVIARTGASVGSAKQIRNLDQQSVFASYLVRIRPSEGVDPHYLGVILESDIYQNWVLGISSGSAQPNANAQMLVDFDVPLPPINTQRRIGVIARNIDDLIENNRRRIEILEESAKALYREWFVHYRYPGHENDTMVDSELGPIPKQWEVEDLEKLLTLNYGKSLKKSERKSGLVKVFGSGGQIGWHDEYLVKGPGIVLGRKGNVGAVYWSEKDFFPIDTTYFVKSEISMRFLYFLLSEQTYSNSHTGVPGLSRDHVYRMKVVFPSEKLIHDFDGRLQAIFDLVDVLRNQTNQICNLRDLLLPRLISGELDVSDLDLVA